MKQNNIGGGDFSFDYYVLEDVSGMANDIKVVAVSCDKREISEFVSLIGSLNLVPAAVDLNPQAVVSVLVNNGQISKGEVVIVLEFGCNNCSLNVVINNQIYLTRDLAVSGRSLTQAISVHRQISYDEAERLKVSLSLMGGEGAANANVSEETAIAVNEALWLHLENLIQEIDYTFKFFLHQVMLMSQVNKLDKIILSGGSANLNRFSTYLSSYLGVPVEVANPLKGLTLHPAVEEQLLSDTTQNFDSFVPRLSVATGLALWEM
jgi:type IV pilus assembly protein PilM